MKTAVQALAAAIHLAREEFYLNTGYNIRSVGVAVDDGVWDRFITIDDQTLVNAEETGIVDLELDGVPVRVRSWVDVVETANRRAKARELVEKMASSTERCAGCGAVGGCLCAGGAAVP